MVILMGQGRLPRGGGACAEIRWNEKGNCKDWFQPKSSMQLIQGLTRERV